MFTIYSADVTGNPGILEQKITDEGCQYQLLVNPEDHPECFIEAA